MPNTKQLNVIETQQLVTGDDVGKSVEDLVSLAQRDAEYFQDMRNETWGALQVGSTIGGYHTEIHPINSDHFKDWLGARCFKANGGAIANPTMDRVISALSASAKFGANAPREVHLRTATLAGRYYIDLGDPRWRVVEVDASGWRILDKSPVMFRRTSTMKALPDPIAGGSFTSLLPIINVPENSWLLLLPWVIECLRPDTPYVGLQLSGIQGSAKSFTQSILRELIDPNVENLRARPRGREDLFAGAHQNLLLSYENLSVLPTDMQDAFCTVLTGGGAGSRKLYSGDQEQLISVKRPVVLNGINEVVTNPDLLDRFICLELNEIKIRKTESELRAAFQAIHPRVFGAVLKWFARALALLPAIKNEPLMLPRMGDFALLGEAVLRSTKRKPKLFLRRYDRQRSKDVKNVIGASSFGAAIEAYLGQNPKGISGNHTEISRALRAHYASGVGRDAVINDWPEGGKAFGNAMRRLQPALVKIGIAAKRSGRVRQGFTWSIRRTSPNA